MKQLAFPLAVERPAWPKARPGEGGIPAKAAVKQEGISEFLLAQ